MSCSKLVTNWFIIKSCKKKKKKGSIEIESDDKGSIEIESDVSIIQIKIILF